MSRPKLVMFDEPSLGVPPNIVDRAFEVIKDIQAGGVTVIMVAERLRRSGTVGQILRDRAGAPNVDWDRQGTARKPQIMAAYLGA